MKNERAENIEERKSLDEEIEDLLHCIRFCLFLYLIFERSKILLHFASVYMYL